MNTFILLMRPIEGPELQHHYKEREPDSTGGDDASEVVTNIKISTFEEN